MLTLRLDEIPAEGLRLEWTEERSSLATYLESFSEIDFDFGSPLRSEARVSKAGRSVLIRGKVEATLHLHCVRCLKEFSYPISSTFDLTLVPLHEGSVAEEMELEQKDLESNFYQGGQIHLSEIACEQIFLDIPIKPLCQEDCKGLCPTCGTDLNLGTCQCVNEQWVSNFSVLQKLKLD